MSLLDADTGGNIVTLSRPDCGQLFFVYAGAKGFMEGLDPMAFLRMTGLMRRNVTLVRDAEAVLTPNGIQATFFENGVSADLPDMESLIDWHRAYIDSFPEGTEVYALGNSFGGWSAMFFGYMLGIKKVFAFAPAGLWGRRLLEDLMRDGNGVTEYQVYYSREHAGDTEFAETFVGYPGVELLPRDDHGHHMLNGLLNSGELVELIPEYRAATDVAPAEGSFG